MKTWGPLLCETSVITNYTTQTGALVCETSVITNYTTQTDALVCETSVMTNYTTQTGESLNYCFDLESTLLFRKEGESPN